MQIYGLFSNYTNISKGNFNLFCKFAQSLNNIYLIMRNRAIAVFAAVMALCAWAERYTNLPTLRIETENHAAITSKEDYVNATASIEAEDPDLVIADVALGIRGRGNSTWGMAKKPYRLKFDKKINLLGNKAKAKSWVLLANYADKTLMRNAVAFKISELVGMDFTPSISYVDLSLNGVYQGNYFLTDQVQVGPGRVDIDEMTSQDTSGAELTGGYFLEIDGFCEGEPVYFYTDRGMPVTVKSPDEETIQPIQLQYVTAWLNKFESALFSDDFDNPDGGFRVLVDQRSLVNWYIACELTGNSDSFWSTYVYKKRGDDKLYVGPLWDFDIAFNNDNRLGDAVNKPMLTNAHQPRMWIERMWQAQWFRKAVLARWRELVDGCIEETLANFIADTAEMLDVSQRLNFKKWNVLNQQVYLEQFLFDTYEEGVDYLAQYVHERIAFLNTFFYLSAAETETGVREGVEYYMLHSTGLLATAENDNFYIENFGSDAQKLTFKKTGNYYNIVDNSGRYLASRTNDKYCTYLSDGGDSRTHFTIEPSPIEGYVIIRNRYTGLCLGVEHTAHWSRISTNKDGADINHAWKVLTVRPEEAGIADVVVKESHLAINGGMVIATGCSIEVYAIDGAKVATGVDAVDVSLLPSGVYVARTAAGDVIKFCK